ncbi:alpha/beta hydrolase [Nocardioides sp. URHA0020]|uniref:alpha/beta hydrolase n=1 Tax=Nocardioides sp. URHA0020 TaxID=1380392 RepID=UPI000490757F|nr:alpha/beta hydrolase [Nocardioides sp. URHA0020]
MTRIVALVLVVMLAITGIGVAALAVLGGSDATSPAPPPVPTTTPGPGATDAPTPALAAYYSQRLAWEPCRSGALCSRLEVPLDYRKPAGRRIALEVLKVPAGDPDKRIGSVVVNPGGPGAAGTDYARSGLVFSPEVSDAYDVVGFDPRGTGDSDPVDCLSDSDLDAYIAQDPDPDTPAEVATYVGFADELGRGCVERSGELASHITTVEAARDMDVLRAALGESEMTYYGASYGTKLGATYADLFPDRVGRMVLDGAIDVALSSRDLSLGQAGGFETALRAYVQDCVDGGDCFLGDSLDAGLARMQRFFEDVDEQPIPAGDRRLEVGNAFYGTVLPLYSRDSWSALTMGLQQAFDGDGSTLLSFSDIYSGRGRNGYTDNGSEAFYAISCLDDPWAIPAAKVPASLSDFEQASPTFGTVFAWGQTSCGGMQARSTEPARTITATGAAPIVVIGTTRDPATPYVWAKSLAAELDSGVLVSRDGDGHTGYTEGNKCVDRAVDAYYLAGTVPDDGLSC